MKKAIFSNKTENMAPKNLFKNIQHYTPDFTTLTD